MERLNLFVGATAFLGATGIVSYIAVTADGPVADTALGALIALVSAGAGYFLRGRVQSPETSPVVPPVPVPVPPARSTVPAGPSMLPPVAKPMSGN